MCAYKESSQIEQSKKREYLKQQHQLRTMSKTSNAISADDMIDNLLSKTEIFKMKKEANPLAASDTSQVIYPLWLAPGYEPLLYRRIWDIVCTANGVADTPKLTNLLLTSRLTTDLLGYIWSLSNTSLAPALSQLETYTAIALVALSQNGYAFTSVAVLNTLKEAPLPKLDLGLKEVGMVMPAGCSGLKVVPIMPTPLYNTHPPIGHGLSVRSSTQPLQLPFQSGAQRKLSSELSETLPPTSDKAVELVSESMSLLDLDLSPIKAKQSGSSLNPINSISILDVDPLIGSSGEVKTEFKNIHCEVNKGFLPASIVAPSVKAVSSISIDTTLANDKETTSSENLSLADELFGEFQSVNCIEPTDPITDEVEFDEFKTADLSSLTVLQVKLPEKPPERTMVQPVVPILKEKTAGVEDLFPRCVLKLKDEGLDLLKEEEDKYSALRGLTSEDRDDYGDFLTAGVGPPTAQPPSLPLLWPSSSPLAIPTNQSNIQERAMEACLDTLEEAMKIFQSIEEVAVLQEVISDPRGVQYLEELIEIKRIAERLQSNIDKIELSSKLGNLSKSLQQYLEPHKQSHIEEVSGPKCGICLCDKGPAYVKYGINNFHAPCANLYLHKVDPILPIAPLM